MRLIPRIDHREASDIVGQLEQGSARVLAGINALKTFLDAGDAFLSHLGGRCVAGGRAREEVLPVGNLLGNPVPEKRGQFGQRWT